MLIIIRYFGMLVEQTFKQQETLEVSENSTIKSLEETLLSKYPLLKNSSYNIAQNQKIVPKESVLSNGDELAFLPPFAGG